MFEKRDAPSLSRANPVNPPETAVPFNWATLSVTELVKIRGEIDRVLPPTRLKDLNMEEQLLIQYHTVLELQGNIVADEAIPANQKAQVANSVSGNLKTLADVQMSLYTSERIKDIENAMMRILQKLPETLAMEFIAEYEKIARKQR